MCAKLLKTEVPQHIWYLGFRILNDVAFIQDTEVPVNLTTYCNKTWYTGIIQELCKYNVLDEVTHGNKYLKKSMSLRTMSYDAITSECFATLDCNLELEIPVNF